MLIVTDVSRYIKKYRENEYLFTINIVIKNCKITNF